MILSAAMNTFDYQLEIDFPERSSALKGATFSTL